MEENVRVVDRVFDILETLAASSSPLGLSEIARSTGMSKSTVHRLMTTMCARHYAEKTSEG
jgi:DNA-binding IclR family transcriptional regulator